MRIVKELYKPHKQTWLHLCALYGFSIFCTFTSFCSKSWSDFCFLVRPRLTGHEQTVHVRKMRRLTKANGPKGKSWIRWRMVSDQKQMATTKGAARGHPRIWERLTHSLSPSVYWAAGHQRGGHVSLNLSMLVRLNPRIHIGRCNRGLRGRGPGRGDGRRENKRTATEGRPDRQHCGLAWGAWRFKKKPRPK